MNNDKPLKVCPFGCERRPFVYRQTPHLWAIKCDDCGCVGPLASHKQAAEEAMKNSNLPDCVGDNDPSAPWNQEDHYTACPQSEDAEPECRECGTDWNCWVYRFPWLFGFRRWLSRHKRARDLWRGDCEIDTDPDCKCGDIADDIEADKADAAEARAELRDDR